MIKLRFRVLKITSLKIWCQDKDGNLSRVPDMFAEAAIYNLKSTKCSFSETIKMTGTLIAS